MRNKAESFDLDGVIIGRPGIQAKALWEFSRRGNEIYTPPDYIPHVPRNIRGGVIFSPSELISFNAHNGRHVVPGVTEFLERRDADIYGNTGRSNKKPWVEMTRNTLRDGEVLAQFQDIFFKPPGTKTIISKGAGIQQLREQYGHVTHYDDNPADVLGLAAYFRDVDFVIVQDWTTGILFSRIEMNNYPNVTRVSKLSAVA